ncbi:MAG: toll/interleukin-1 receptor domain-containing protein [Chloroflexota bacterium]
MTPAPSPGSYVFISYSSQDRRQVQPIVDSLTAAGFNVWFDQQQIKPGQPWPDVLEKAVQDCGAFIVVMSPAARASAWVGNEVALARRLNKPLLPLLLAGEVWWDFARVQFELVQSGQPLSAEFMAQLAQHIPRRTQSGDVFRTTAGMTPPVPGPPSEGRSSGWPLLLTAAGVLVLMGAAILLALLGGSSGDADTTNTPAPTAATRAARVADASGETPTSQASPSPTMPGTPTATEPQPVDVRATDAPVLGDLLAAGADPAPSPRLMNCAARHASYVSSLPLNILTAEPSSVYTDRNGQPAAYFVPVACGHDGPVAMAVIVNPSGDVAVSAALLDAVQTAGIDPAAVGVYGVGTTNRPSLGLEIVVLLAAP